MYRSFLAPLFDYTDLPFRIMCRSYGADAACLPMLNSLAAARKGVKELSDAHPDERNLGIQVVGEDPGKIGDTCKAIADSMGYVSWLNLNCGCPSPRTMRCGGGSAMLEHPEKITESVRLMRRADLPVSVKIRVKDGIKGTIELCRQIEDAGADFIIIHGRSVKQGYSGNSNWELIRSVKYALNIPVVGNGDIQSASQGEGYVKDGYCDSFMVGRAAMSNPMLFRNQKAEGMKGGMELLSEYIGLSEKYFGEAQLVPVKLKAMNFISGTRNAAKIRNMISNMHSIEEIRNLDIED